MVSRYSKTNALLLLAAAFRVQAQGTASLFPVGFQGDDLQGSVVGTGADGTTYVLSAPEFDTLGMAYTSTFEPSTPEYHMHDHDDILTY
jgi:hypothetical protein